MTANWLATWVLQSRTAWFRVDWRGMGAIFLPGFIAGASGMLLSHQIKPFVAAALALLLYLALLRISRPFRHNEIRPLERAIGQRAGGVLRGFAV
jgi:uncharacterized membrane protein YfcA